MRKRPNPELWLGLLCLGAVTGVALAQPAPRPGPAVTVEAYEITEPEEEAPGPDAPAGQLPPRPADSAMPAADSAAGGTSAAGTSAAGASAVADDDGNGSASAPFDDDSDAAVTAGPPPLPANWLETQAAIEEYADEGNFDAALALRDQLLDLTEQEFGIESTRIAEAHLKIADVYRQSGDYVLAEEEILLAVDAYMDVSGPLSPDLIAPYLVLGDTYVEAGDFRSGITAYSEARTLGRRNFGLLNADQLEIIDAMSDAAERLGESAEARALQLEALTLIERSFTELSPETIEARYKYAEWLRRHRLFDDERRIYYQIERVIRDEFDSDPVMSVRLLRERARSFRVADSGDGVGLGALSDALKIIEGMPDPPPLLHAEVLVEIGDWYVEFARTRPFGTEYLQAWMLLGEVEGGRELRREWFDRLVQIEMASLSRRDLTTDPEAPQGHVVVYFTIDTAGRTQDIEITDSEPPGFKDAAVQRLIREARFRPRIINGELVPVRRAYRFEFRYIPPEQQ